MINLSCLEEQTRNEIARIAGIDLAGKNIVELTLADKLKDSHTYVKISFYSIHKAQLVVAPTGAGGRETYRHHDACVTDMASMTLVTGSKHAKSLMHLVV